MTTEQVTIRLLGQVRLEPGGTTRGDVVPTGRRGIVVLARLAVDAGTPVGHGDLADTVWPDGRPDRGGTTRGDVVPPGRRGIVVLARLAVDAGTPVGHGDLADTVWPDGRPAAWQASLRNVIADVRGWCQQVGLSSAVVVSPTGYRLDLPVTARVDVHVLGQAAARAESALAAGGATAALAVVDAALPDVRAGVLVGLDGPWVTRTRHRVDAAASSLFVAGATAALCLGDPARAEVLAARALEWDDVRESAHRVRIEALTAAGNRGAALAAYQHCRDVLVDRLGSEPDAATRALFEALLVEPDLPAVAARALELLRTTAPLVGRRDVVRRLDDLLRAVHRGGGPLVVGIEGEAGVGKTRLAAEVAARANRQGVPVLYGRADEHLDVPHRPVLEAVDTHLASLGPRARRDLLGPHAPQLAAVVPSVRDVVAVVPPSGLPVLDRTHLAAGLAEVLTAVARPRGAVLVLDDMHWSSRPTAELLDHLCRLTAGVPLLVLVLRRPGGSGGVATGEVIALPGLDPDEIAALAVSTVPGGVPAGTAAAVWAASGGNPLYASELLCSGGAGPVADGDLAPTRSRRLRQLVRGRVGGFQRGTTAWLDVAAVAGLEFEPELVRAASGLPPDVAAAALREAEADGLVVAATSGPTRRAFRHALVRQCLLDDLDDDPVHVMALHRQLGAALETHGGASLPRLARHAHAAAPLGDWRRAVRYGLAAAGAAAVALVHDDVVAICERTLAVLAAAGDPDVAARVRLTVLLGGAQCGRHDPAGDAALAAAFEQALALGDPVLAAAAALGFTSAGAAGDELAVDTRHLALYERALAALGDTADGLRAQLLGRLSTAHSWLRDGESGRRYAEQAVALAREVGDPAVVSTVLVSRRRGLSGTGRPDQERAVEDELLAVAAELDDPGTTTGAWLWRFESAVGLGRGDELEACLGAAAPGVATLGVPSYRYTAAYAEAARLLLRGDVEAADATVEHAYRLGVDLGIDPLAAGGIRMIQLMGVRHEQGRLADLRDELADHFARSGVPEWEGAVAFVDAELGRYDTVNGYLAKAFAGYAAGGVRTGAGISFAAHLAAPVAHTGDIARAEVLHDLLLPHRGVGSYIAYFAGPVDHALALLARTLGRHDRAARHAADAVAFSTRLGAPRWVARCRALAGS